MALVSECGREIQKFTRCNYLNSSLIQPSVKIFNIFEDYTNLYHMTKFQEKVLKY